MSTSILKPHSLRMPEFAPGDWINVNAPLDRAQLRGRLVLIDFWDYSCVNCLRTLPYLVAWADRYAEAGLTVIGVHTPEFRFAADRAQVQAAALDYDLRYPLLLDQGQRNWDYFAVKAWPTKFLVDPGGYIRVIRQGEGAYAQLEALIQGLLRETHPEIELPALIEPLRPEDESGALCYRSTPELYAGYERGSLGNPEGYAAEGPLVYRLPLAMQRAEPNFYAGGIWRATPEALAFAGRDEGLILLPYTAAGVNAVLSPSADPVETMLAIRPTEQPPVIEVLQDGAYLYPEIAGPDILYDDGGVSYVLVERPRLYQLVRNPDHSRHELELRPRAHGLALYSFTFERCLALGAYPDDPDVFRME